MPLTLRSTRRATAGFARFRTRVNSNVRPSLEALSNMFGLIKQAFKTSLGQKLVTLYLKAKRENFSCGKQVHCRISVRPHNKFGISASIITNSASLGDVNGVYHVYSSENFDDFKTALHNLTREVADASVAVPECVFFRSLEFSIPENAIKYAREYSNITDREKWLFQSLNWDWRSSGVWVEEKYENGSWTMHFTEKHDEFHLLSDTINSPYA